MQVFPEFMLEVREAMIAAYAEINDVDVPVVAAGYEGGLPFDSLLGVELACAMEAHFEIEIPEERLMSPRLYRSLSAFATVVQKALDEQNRRTSG